MPLSQSYLHLALTIEPQFQMLEQQTLPITTTAITITITITTTTTTTTTTTIVLRQFPHLRLQSTILHNQIHLQNEKKFKANGRSLFVKPFHQTRERERQQQQQQHQQQVIPLPQRQRLLPQGHYRT